MKDRIKLVQKELRITQVDFADRIGISRSALQKLQSGENNPSEQTLRAICSEFRVNRVWLDTGEGDMFRTMSREDELMVLFADLLKDEPGFKHRLISALLRMEPSEWAVLEKLALDAVEEMKKADPQ